MKLDNKSNQEVIDIIQENKIEILIDTISLTYPDRTGILNNRICPLQISWLAYCNTLGIPYYIFSYPGMELNKLEPEKNLTDLYGREYEFGVTDCFEAMRDYLAEQNISIPPRILFEDNWFEKGLDYFDPKDFISPNVVDHAEGKNPVSVGRLRLDLWNSNRVNFWVVADNLRKGAALNSLQILDEL